MNRDFSHEALLYAGEDGFLGGAVPFLREGLEADDAMLVVVGERKIELLRSELGRDGERITFADMAEVGSNPARIIPAWRDFADDHSGRALRGIGEPIWAERSPDELVECQRHESLLNLAFADTPAFRLVCPYDVDALPSDVVEEAERSHPHVVEGGCYRDSPCYRGLDAVAAPFRDPLPEPPERPTELRFDIATLATVRDLVARRAAEADIDGVKAEDLVLAVNEIATNSVRYGGGDGALAIWRDNSTLICEIRDGGQIEDPLAGRKLPGRDVIGGNGLWLANQLCDLVQVRTVPDGTVVRIHARHSY